MTITYADCLLWLYISCDLHQTAHWEARNVLSKEMIVKKLNSPLFYFMWHVNVNGTLLPNLSQDITLKYSPRKQK